MQKLLLALLAIALLTGCGSTSDLGGDVMTQSIGLEGIENARELGGYASSDGRKIKHGIFLRTAQLAGGTEEDYRKLTQEYHLSVAADFRSDEEIALTPDPELEGVRNVHIPIMDAELNAERMKKALEYLDGEELDLHSINTLIAVVKSGIISENMYVEFLEAKAGKEGYAKFFREILSLPEGKSILFHCSQGKDRTGLGAMLILSALDVDEDTIMRDYMLTNEFQAKKIAERRRAFEQIPEIAQSMDIYMMATEEVNANTMIKALNHLKENYGSVKGYIVQELGISEEDIALMKEKFLQ